MKPDKTLQAYEMRHIWARIGAFARTMSSVALLVGTGFCAAAPPISGPASENLATLIDNLAPFERGDSPTMQTIRRSVGPTPTSRGESLVRDGVEEGTWQGVVEVISLSPPEKPTKNLNTGATQVFLHRNGEPDQVYFLNNMPPGLTSGVRMTAHGFRRGNRVLATDVYVNKTRD